MAFPALSRARILLQPQSQLLSTAIRSLSSSASIPTGEHWSAPFRRRLGVGRSPVLFRSPLGIGPWQPPNPGELKLNFSVSLPRGYTEVHTIGIGIGGGTGEFRVLARTSSGDLVGLTHGVTDFDTMLGLQLYALKAAGNLSWILKERGYHGGPVVYESEEVMTRGIVRCDGQWEPKEVVELEELVPGDLEDVGSCCKTHIGYPDELLKKLDGRFPWLRELIRRDKIDADLV